MKGSNQLSINQATMIEAVQEWLDKRWKRGDIRVVGVRQVNTGTTPCFDVSLTEKDPDPVEDKS